MYAPCGAAMRGLAPAEQLCGVSRKTSFARLRAYIILRREAQSITRRDAAHHYLCPGAVASYRCPPSGGARGVGGAYCVSDGFIYLPHAGRAGLLPTA